MLLLISSCEYAISTMAPVMAPTIDTTDEVSPKELGYVCNPYRYAGYEYLEQIGIYDLNARYYNPEIARFLSPDPYYNLGNRVIGLYEINVPNAWSIIQANNVYVYCGNNPKQFVDTFGTDAIILTAEGSAGGFGHTSALYQDAEGIWYYTYWGKDAAAVIRLPDVISECDEYGNINFTYTMESLESLNHVLNNKVTENGWKKIVTEYTDATYVFGDFTSSLEDALDVTASVMDSKSTSGTLEISDGYTVFQGKNGYYGLFTNNCLQVTYENFSKGYLENDMLVSQYMLEFFLIPNVSRYDFALYFFNYEFTKSGAQKQIDQIYELYGSSVKDKTHNVYYKYLETIAKQND